MVNPSFEYLYQGVFQVFVGVLREGDKEKNHLDKKAIFHVHLVVLSLLLLSPRYRSRKVVQKIRNDIDLHRPHQSPTLVDYLEVHNI